MRNHTVTVPAEPTPEMLHALRTGSFRDYPSDELCRVRYATMLAAAPQEHGVQNPMHCPYCFLRFSDRQPGTLCPKCYRQLHLGDPTMQAKAAPQEQPMSQEDFSAGVERGLAIIENLGNAAPQERPAEPVNQQLLEALRGMVDLAEFWINREDRREYSDQQFRTWHALGHGSNAMRDARAAIAAAEQPAEPRDEPVAWISTVQCIGAMYGKEYYGKLPIQSLQDGYYKHTPLYSRPFDPPAALRLADEYAERREHRGEDRSEGERAALAKYLGAA